MSNPVYDRIGKAYNSTRCADPYITERVYQLLSPVPDGLYLDIGCGTGNYLAALSARGMRFMGVDPSEVMLAQARLKNPDVELLQAGAEALPLEADLFDGGIALFTLHHWKDKKAGLKGVCRVLKPGSRLVFMSFTGEQMRQYWLNHYFPDMIRRSWELLPELPGMEALLEETGFRLIETEEYYIQEDLQDHFLYAHKTQPEQYLKAEIRNNMSSFSAFCEPEELQSGLGQLEQDIATGRISEVLQQYQSTKGDYLFLVAEKVQAP